MIDKKTWVLEEFIPPSQEGEWNQLVMSCSALQLVNLIL